jgi:signal transduction histidine kinase
MSIRARLAVAYGLALATTIALTGVLVWLEMSGSLMQSVEETLATRAEAVLSSLENQGQTGLQESDVPEPGVWTALLNKQGAVIDSTVGAPATLPTAPGQFVSGGRRYLTRIDHAQDGTTVVTGADLASLQAAEAALARILLGIGLSVGSLSLVAGWLLAGRALRPIGRLIIEAEALDASDLSRRLNVPAQRDEVGRLTMTLNLMLDRMSDAVSRQRLFIAQASHELRTPLAALRAELDLADDDAATLADYRVAIRDARVDAMRLGNLATELLQLAAGDESQQLVRGRVALRDLTTSALRSIAPLAGRAQAAINVDVPDLEIVVDRTRLEQAIVNLLSNAILHSSGPASVDLTGDVSGGFLRITVADRGPGFGDGDLRQLFEPFQRGRNARGPGSGLGLALVAAVARAHGGSFGAMNRPDGGAVVSIWIPDVDEEPPSRDTAATVGPRRSVVEDLAE